MNIQSSVDVRVTRSFNALPGRVFDAWLDPETIERWMFGPAVREEEIARMTLDARVGGSFSFVVRRQGEEIDHVGKYLEIDRPHRLVFTWGVPKYSPDMARVILDIAPLDHGSELTLTHELHPKWAEYATRTEAGWKKMLDVLAGTLG